MKCLWYPNATSADYPANDLGHSASYFAIVSAAKSQPIVAKDYVLLKRFCQTCHLLNRSCGEEG